MFIPLDTILERVRRTNGIPLAITALCIASNADALEKRLKLTALK